MASQPVYVTNPPKKGTSPLLIGCLAIMLFGAFGMVMTAIVGTCSKTSGPSSAPVTDTAREDLKRRATEKLKTMTEWSDAVAVARLCEQGDLAQVGDEVKKHCASAHLQIAKQRLEAGRVPEARAAFSRAVSEGAGGKATEAVEKPLKRAEEAERKNREAIERAAAKLTREAYAAKLRERYLDQGMDIKVKVSGKNSDRLTLTYVLFNDVWNHKFSKGDALGEMRSLGFRRVDMTDGYDYHVYWDFK